MYCGQCCVTEARLRAAPQLDIFIEILLLRRWVNRVASDALRAYDKPLIQHPVLYDTMCFRTLTFQTILDTLDTYKTAIA